MIENNTFIKSIMFLLGVTFIVSCNYHPDRNMILDLEKGTAKIDSVNPFHHKFRNPDTHQQSLPITAGVPISQTEPVHRIQS